MEKKINEKIQELHSEEVKSENLSENSCKDSEEKPLQSTWRSRFIKLHSTSINRFLKSEFKSDKSLFLLFDAYLLDSANPVPLLFGTYLHFTELNKGISYFNAISLLVRENLAVNHSYALALVDVLEYVNDSWISHLSNNSSIAFLQAPIIFNVYGTEKDKIIQLVKWCRSVRSFKEFLKNEI